MRKQIKTLVNQDFEVMKPFVIRDQGNVPPILFFHFKDIKPEVVKGMNFTTTNDEIAVESGFFVPMSKGSVLQNREAFLGFMATIMASLEHMGITGKLHSVVILLSGNAIKTNPETGEQSKAAQLFISSGVDAKGNKSTKAQEIKIKMGEDSLVCELVDSEFIDSEINNTADVFLGGFFDSYEENLLRIPEDKKNLGILEDSMEDYDGDAAQFVADMVDSAIHATALFDSIKQDT